MQQIVECVPNFSDGRRPAVYNAIADAIRAVRGTQVLDVSADPDHNRTVITFVGTPEAVEEAAFQAIAEAAKHINLDEHSGEHPRIGATDVCPFIPVKGIKLGDCIAMARRVGRRVGEELGIAVYLYARAASRPDREQLSNIRRGEYERWKEEVAIDPDRQPDFGPAEPKPWGATVIGARPFLIAYNIYLNSSDVAVAEQIARNVRFSSGGFRYAQAMGFLVEGQAQVSMNLTNFDKTAIHHVQEFVRREAARYGLTITKAELIGLVPQKAFLAAAKWYLQLDEMEDNQILEIRMAETTESEEGSLQDFLDETAAATTTPGGGSAAALAGALATALTQMVGRLTAGRKKYAAVDEEANQLLRRAGQLRSHLTTAIAEDAAAFEALMSAWKDRSLSQEEQEAAVEKATIGAGEVPLQVARLSRQAADLALQIARIGNANAVTDAAAGALLARAAVQTAGLNVKINGVGLKDRSLAEKWQAEVDELMTEAEALAAQAMTVAAERGGF